VEYGGAIDHVMNRADRREPSFQDDQDRDGSTGPVPMGCRHVGRPAQWRCEKGIDRTAVATGDDADAGVDCHPACSWEPNPTCPTLHPLRGLLKIWFKF